MKEFETWRDYWKFKQKVCQNLRYIHDDWLNSFLEKILYTAKKRIITRTKGEILYRAQLGYETKPVKTPIQTQKGRELKEIGRAPAPYPSERMKPLPLEAREGRANPKGIPYLYLATEKETALSEVRPWLGSIISLATLEITKDLKIIDCSKDRTQKVWYMGQDPSPKEKEELIWTLINHAFSVPITTNDRTADYCPTQILAELFKHNEFDGIVYRSMLGNKGGSNIVLFDLDSARVTDVSLYSVKLLKYEFERKNGENDSWYLYSDHLEKEYERFLKE